MTILNIISPIKLLSGHHGDTGTTGQGCTMDVISYLSGDKIITDHTECVCFVVTPLVIWLQDYLTDHKRSLMIPYIPRLMGSRSYDPAVFVPRAQAVARFANKCSEIADRAWGAARAVLVANAAMLAAACADAAECEGMGAAMSAKEASTMAEIAASLTDGGAKASARRELIKSAFIFLDESLPQAAETPPVVIERALALRSLCVT